MSSDDAGKTTPKQPSGDEDLIEVGKSGKPVRSGTPKGGQKAAPPATATAAPGLVDRPTSNETGSASPAGGTPGKANVSLGKVSSPSANDPEQFAAITDRLNELMLAIGHVNSTVGDLLTARVIDVEHAATRSTAGSDGEGDGGSDGSSEDDYEESDGSEGSDESAHTPSSTA